MRRAFRTDPALREAFAAVLADAGHGAPARDSQPPHTAWHWFRRITDGASLTDVAS